MGKERKGERERERERNKRGRKRERIATVCENFPEKSSSYYVIRHGHVRTFQ